MNLEALNRRFAIDDQLTVRAGPGHFPLLQIDNENATAVISVYGAQVLSYRPLDESQDLLFVSPAAYYREGKAIKGGIPLCWPWFGPDPKNSGRPAHGFARNLFWTVVATEAVDPGTTRVLLGLEPTAATRAIWDHEFSLQLEVVVGSRLDLALSTRNRGKATFHLTQALHTYFAIGDIEQVRVHGLDGTTYLDKAGDGGRRDQSGPVTVAGEVDRIYLGVDEPLVIEDPVHARRIRIEAAGSHTAVVWNPWKAIAARMGDLEDEDYRRFLCVETANAASEVIPLAPAELYRIGASYRVER